MSGRIIRNFSLLSRSRTLPTRIHFPEGPGTVSMIFSVYGALYIESYLPLQNMPFQTKNKARLFVVLFGGAALGFSLPLIATWFQLRKKQTS